jgi:hypothetical protein
MQEPQQGDRRMNATWEHKVLTFQLGWKGFDYDQIEQDLNEFGRQGWETVGTITPSFGAGQAIEVVIILKRPGA